MKWSEQTWKKIDPIYQSIINMPFVMELADGTLPLDKFRFYMAQDSLYLEHFGRSLALIGARAHDVKDTLTYLTFAKNAIIVENELHVSYFKDFDVTDKGILQPSCHHYTHFLKSTAALEAVEVAMAATLPCFWIYKKVGDHIYRSKNTSNNPYRKWIETYGGEEFGIAVNKAIDCCDAVAAATTDNIRDKMTEAFTSATILELDFWDSAYCLRNWKE